MRIPHAAKRRQTAQPSAQTDRDRYTVMNTLCGLGMSLTRTGGRSDAGIDLTGTWVAPTASNAAHPLPPVSVYVSCKALQGTRKTGPSLLRELVGTINATPQGVDAFGILAAATPCTEETRKRLAMSTAALGFVCITPQEVEMVKRGRGRPANGAEQEWVLKEGGVLRQFIWNDAAAEMLGRGLGCTARYVLPKPGEVAQNGGVIEEVVLTLDGIPIKPEKKRSTRSKKTKM